MADVNGEQPAAADDAVRVKNPQVFHGLMSTYLLPHAETLAARINLLAEARGMNDPKCNAVVRHDKQTAALVLQNIPDKLGHTLDTLARQSEIQFDTPTPPNKHLSFRLTLRELPPLQAADKLEMLAGRFDRLSERLQLVAAKERGEEWEQRREEQDVITRLAGILDHPVNRQEILTAAAGMQGDLPRLLSEAVQHSTLTAHVPVEQGRLFEEPPPLTAAELERTRANDKSARRHRERNTGNRTRSGSASTDGATNKSSATRQH